MILFLFLMLSVSQEIYVFQILWFWNLFLNVIIKYFNYKKKLFSMCSGHCWKYFMEMYISLLYIPIQVLNPHKGVCSTHSQTWKKAWSCDLGSRKCFKIAENLWKENGSLIKFKPHFLPDFPQFSRIWPFCVEIVKKGRYLLLCTN